MTYSRMPGWGSNSEIANNSSCVRVGSGQMGQWERALRLLQEMREAGVQPDLVIYNMLLSACDSAGQLRPALRVLREMKDVRHQAMDRFRSDVGLHGY